MHRIFVFAISIGLVFPVLAYGDKDYPVFEFPILGSEHIGDNCSLETNQVIAIVQFSRQGDVIGFEFVKKSTIPIINVEAKEFITSYSPYSEFEDMSDDEAARHRKVFMYYSVPCRNSE